MITKPAPKARKKSRNGGRSPACKPGAPGRTTPRSGSSRAGSTSQPHRKAPSRPQPRRNAKGQLWPLGLLSMAASHCNALVDHVIVILTSWSEQELVYRLGQPKQRQQTVNSLKQEVERQTHDSARSASDNQQRKLSAPQLSLLAWSNTPKPSGHCQDEWSLCRWKTSQWWLDSNRN